DPDIFPRKIDISPVGADLLWKQHEAFPAFDMVFMRFPLFILSGQHSGAGNDIVKEIMIFGNRTKCMGGSTLLPAILIECKVNEIFVWKYGKQVVVHRCASSFFCIIYQNARSLQIIFIIQAYGYKSRIILVFLQAYCYDIIDWK